MGLSLGPIFWTLVALSAAAAIVYGLFFLTRPESLLRAGVKTLFMGALAAALLAGGAHPLLILACAASAAGDFFLAFDRKWMLPLGILAFLIAQLTYLAIFFFTWLFAGEIGPLWPRYLAMATLALSVLVYLFWFWRDDLKSRAASGAAAVLSILAVGMLLPAYVILAVAVPQIIAAPPAWDDLGLWGLLALLALATAFGWLRRDMGALRLGAMVYAGAITAMALAAMWQPWPSWPAMLGAVSFLASDLVLAAELFRMPPDAPARGVTAPVVWWTYAAAQALIVIGITILDR